MELPFAGLGKMAKEQILVIEEVGQVKSSILNMFSLRFLLNIQWRVGLISVECLSYRGYFKSDWMRSLRSMEIEEKGALRIEP